MTVRPALIATVRLIKGAAAERADRQDPSPPQRGVADRFDRGQGQGRGLGNADSGGGDPKGGTQIGWNR